MTKDELVNSLQKRDPLLANAVSNMVDYISDRFPAFINSFRWWHDRLKPQMRLGNPQPHYGRWTCQRWLYPNYGSVTERQSPRCLTTWTDWASFLLYRQDGEVFTHCYAFLHGFLTARNMSILTMFPSTKETVPASLILWLPQPHSITRRNHPSKMAVLLQHNLPTVPFLP